jgi:hypothetical protein
MTSNLSCVVSTNDIKGESITVPKHISDDEKSRFVTMKVAAHNALMKCLAKNNVTARKTSMVGKYVVYRTGYTSRIEKHIPSALSKYNPESKCFIKVSASDHDNIEPHKTYNGCKGCDRSGDECPHHSIICFIDTLHGDGLYMCDRYFNMSDIQQKSMSNDILMIVNSYEPGHVSGTVIFENRIIHPTLSNVTLTDGAYIDFQYGYKILKEFQYCNMQCLTDVEIIHVTDDTSGYTFDYVNVYVDSESG